jgi:GAF domain-containing protein
MRSLLASDFQHCADVHSVLDCLLDRSLDLTATSLGNVQLMNWTSGHLDIAAQRGFGPEFLNFFKRVEIEHDSACARALRTRGAIIIDDVMIDRGFSPYRDIVSRAGVRAVQSIPLVSNSGALVGVLSNHFTAVQRPTDLQRQGLQEIAELAADAIIRIRATDLQALVARSLALLEQSYRTLEHADKLLSGDRHAAIGGHRPQVREPILPGPCLRRASG